MGGVLAQRVKVRFDARQGQTGVTGSGQDARKGTGGEPTLDCRRRAEQNPGVRIPLAHETLEGGIGTRTKPDAAGMDFEFETSLRQLVPQIIQQEQRRAAHQVERHARNKHDPARFFWFVGLPGFRDLAALALGRTDPAFASECRECGPQRCAAHLQAVAEFVFAR